MQSAGAPSSSQDFQKLGEDLSSGANQATSQERQNMIDKGEAVSVNPNKSKPTFLGNVARGIVKLPVRAGLNLYGAGLGLAGLADLAMGDQDAANALAAKSQDLDKNGIKSNYLGDTYAIGFGKTKKGQNFGPFDWRGLADSVGAGAEGASYLVGGEGAAPIVKGLGKEALTELAIQGAKAGGKAGFIGGLGSGMQEGAKEDTFGQGVKDTAVGAAQGTAGGIIGGGILSPIAGATTGILRRGTQVASDLASPSEDAGRAAIQKVEDRVNQWLGLTQEQIDKSKARTLPTTAPDGTTIPGRPSAVETLMRNDALEPSVESTNKLYAKNNEYAAAAKKWASQEQADFPLDETLDNIKSNVKQYTNSAAEAKKILSHVDEEIAALEENGDIPPRDPNGNPRTVKADVLERLRKVGNDWAYNQKKTRINPELENAGKLLGDSVRDTVEKHGTFPDYREFNREWGDLINAQNFHDELLQGGGKTNGKAMDKTSIIKLLGLKPNSVTGKVLDSLGLNAVFDYVSNPDTASYFDKKIFEASSKGRPEGSALERLVKSLEDYSAKQKAAPEGAIAETVTASKGRLRERVAQPKEEIFMQGSKKYKLITGPDGKQRVEEVQ